MYRLLLLLLVVGMLPVVTVHRAAATMPVGGQHVLHAIERDIGGMLEQGELLRSRLRLPFDVEGPGVRLAGIHDGDYRSTWRALRQSMLRLERNLARLRPTLRENADGGGGEILLAMRVELSAMSLALTELAGAEGEAARNEALARLDASLQSLDGAVAATWALDPQRVDEPMAIGALAADLSGNTDAVDRSGAVAAVNLAGAADAVDRSGAADAVDRSGAADAVDDDRAGGGRPIAEGESPLHRD